MLTSEFSATPVHTHTVLACPERLEHYVLAECTPFIEYMIDHTHCAHTLTLFSCVLCTLVVRLCVQYLNGAAYVF